MRPFIPIKVHNFIDYLAGLVLLASPSFFGFEHIYYARNTFLVLGGGLIAYSLLTRYPYAILRVIPLNVHMVFDVVAGIVLMAAPWLFDYRASLTDGQLGLHFVLGFAVLGLVYFTYPKTQAVKAKPHITPPFQGAA